MAYLYTLAVQILATAEPVPISEGGEGGGGLRLLLPVPEELIAGLIAFGIVFAVVWKFGIPALEETLDARAAAIKADLDAAEQAKQEAESLLDDYRAQLAGAREEAARIVEEAREAAEEVRADILSRAEAEAEAIRGRAREEIAAERERVAAELKQQVADLAIEIAGKLVAESLDVERQRQLVDRYIEELGGVR